MALLNPDSLVPKVPIEEQTVDLPHNPSRSVSGAVEAQESRDDLRKAMRNRRRSGIKESNYLKTM
jgi:large subunit ribosomal protein L54